MDLLHDARAGDESAFTELYRRHRAAALRVARGYGAGFDAEDLVNTAFERVMLAVRRGRGPLDAFRPYLYVTVRHLAIEQAGRVEHERVEDLPERVLAVSGLPALDLAERTLVCQAFSDLPERWQAVLWMVSVEGRQPREVARATGLHPNTVSVLAHRARERLRQTYLQAHVRTSSTGSCTPHRSRLGAYVRGGLGRRQRAAAADHVAGCAHCERLVAELDEVNSLLARAILPVFAIGARDGLGLTAGGAGTAGAAGAGAFGLSAAGGGGATLGAAGVAASAASSGLAIAGAGAGAMATATAAVAVAATVGLATLAPHDLGLIAAVAPPAEATGFVAGPPPGAVEQAQPSGFDFLAPRPVRAPATTPVAGSIPLPGDLEVDDHDDVGAGGLPGTDAGAAPAAGGPPPVDRRTDDGTASPSDALREAAGKVAAAQGDVRPPMAPLVVAAAQGDVRPPKAALVVTAAQGDVRPPMAPEVAAAQGDVRPPMAPEVAAAVGAAPTDIRAPMAPDAVGAAPTDIRPPMAPDRVTAAPTEVGVSPGLGPEVAVAGTRTVDPLDPGSLAVDVAEPRPEAPDQTALARDQVDSEVSPSAVAPITPAA